MDNESEKKIRDIVEEVFSESVSLETKELIYRLIIQQN